MIQGAISPSCIPSVFIIADKTIQCIFVLVIFTDIANGQVLERVTVLKARTRAIYSTKHGNSQFIRQ